MPGYLGHCNFGSNSYQSCIDAARLHETDPDSCQAVRSSLFPCSARYQKLLPRDTASRASAQALAWGSPGYLETAQAVARSLSDNGLPASQASALDLVVCADCVYADQVCLN